MIQPLFEATLGRQWCDWHDALARALRPGDTVISFNYDCVMDHSLRDMAKRNWDPANGYGVAATGDLDAWRDHSGTGRFPVNQLRLLKLHGSLNWDRQANGDLIILSDPYSARSEDALRIVPPLWQRVSKRRRSTKSGSRLARS